MNRIAYPAVLLILSVLLTGSGGVGAQSGANDPPAKTKQSGFMLPESVRRVERQTGGEVLRAEPMQRDGREVYRLKVLTADGRVRVVQDDPNAGQPTDAPRNRRPAENKQVDKKQADPPPSRDPDEEP